MTHPHTLTDEMCEKIGFMCQWSGDIGDTVFRHSDMRAVADWQLERCIEWLKDELDYDPHLLLDLKEAMRPQQPLL